MENLYKLYRDANQIDFKKVWQEGVFIFDSNVLLDLYRLPESAKEDLINVLKNKNFNKRIWIGFQVILEFLSNRLNIIGEQKNMFTKVNNITKEIEQKVVELNESFSIEIDKLNLKQRHSSINPETYINTKNLKKTTKVFRKFLKHLEDLEKEHMDVNDNDNLKDVVAEIFKNKIGKPFQKEELLQIYKEGDDRYSKNFPPGYMDAKKKDSYFYEDKEFIRKFGDLILWKEIIKEAKTKKLKYVVLITGDVKEDWWEEKRGKKIGARKELLNEIYQECPDLEVFHLYNPSTFLKFAKEEIDDKIKDSSISDIEELMNYDLNIKNLKKLQFKLKKSYINSIQRNLNFENHIENDEFNESEEVKRKIFNECIIKQYLSENINDSDLKTYNSNSEEKNNNEFYKSFYNDLKRNKFYKLRDDNSSLHEEDKKIYDKSYIHFKKNKSNNED